MGFQHIAQADRPSRSQYPASLRVESPRDHTIEDDVPFFDLGPVFEEYEADFGRTFVLGRGKGVRR